MAKPKPVKVKLTSEQREAIKKATGQDFKELHVQPVESRKAALRVAEEAGRKAPLRVADEEARKAPLRVDDESARKAPLRVTEETARKAPAVDMFLKLK